MATVQLSVIPAAGTDLEHYVAALFQASGYFVEKNLIERDPGDVLELDVVVTRYVDGTSVSTLLEVKGGGWGYADAFKVLGWKQYLGLPHAALFVKSGDKVAEMKTKLAPFGVAVTRFEDFADPIGQFAAEGYGAIPDPALVGIWRHSYDIELKLRELLIHMAKSQPGSAGAQASQEYQRLVNDGVFFAKSPLERLTMLYDAYKGHPKLTLATAVEKSGGVFDPHSPTTNNPLLTEALLEGKHPLLQACMFNEHRARLAILKAAIDFAVEHPAGKALTGADAIAYGLLPQTFHAGLTWLRQQPTFHRYAVLWQQFLWGWGGFYLQHKQQEEFEWISAYSGVPVGELAGALTAFDQFFPLGENWLRTAGWSDVRFTVMVPTYFQGLGAHHRRQQYELQDNLNALGGAQYTVSDLARWNNAAVAFLTT